MITLHLLHDILGSSASCLKEAVYIKQYNALQIVTIINIHNGAQLKTGNIQNVNT